MDFPIQVTPGIDVNQQIGFVAKSISIDNPTGQWFYLNSPGRWIPPYIVHMVISTPGTQVANIINNTPIGQISFPKSGEIAQFIFNDLTLPDSTGIPVSSQISSTPVLQQVQVWADGIVRTGQHRIGNVFSGIGNNQIIRVVSGNFHMWNPSSAPAQMDIHFLNSKTLIDQTLHSILFGPNKVSNVPLDSNFGWLEGNPGFDTIELDYGFTNIGAVPDNARYISSLSVVILTVQ